MARRTLFRTLIVKARMFWADIRGHHGKRWNYEPGDWYMGRHNKKKIIEKYYIMEQTWQNLTH